ncbi:MAG: archease [Candidatus Binatia bacterium]
MPYEFLEEVAVADIAFKAWGKDLPELFVAAAGATLNVMVEDLDSIRPVEERKMKFENDALDMLLFDFLQELIYYKDAEELLLKVERVTLEEKDARFFVAAHARGEKIDPSRHRLRVDVKAVTLHQFRIEANNQGWEAQVILDI